MGVHTDTQDLVPAEAADHGTPKRRRWRHPKVIAIQLSVQWLRELSGAVAVAAETARKKLAARLPVQLVCARVNYSGLKPSMPDYVAQMAGIQRELGGLLGDLPTDPDELVQVLAVARAAKEARDKLLGLANLLGNVEASCLRRARFEASLIYDRAVAVAATQPDVARAIAGIRAARSQIAKKGVTTRRLKAEAKRQDTPPPQPPPSPPGTVTVTTTTR